MTFLATLRFRIRRCSAATKTCTCENHPSSAKPSERGRYEPPSQVPHLIPSVIIATTHQQPSSQHRLCLHSASALTARLHVWLVQLSLVILCSQLGVDKERRLATAAHRLFNPIGLNAQIALSNGLESLTNTRRDRFRQLRQDEGESRLYRSQNKQYRRVFTYTPRSTYLTANSTTRLAPSTLTLLTVM